MRPPLSLADALAGRRREAPVLQPDAPACAAARPGEFCSDGWHLAGTHEEPGAALYRCPRAEAARVQGRLEAERARLAGALQRSGDGFVGYDTRRFGGAVDALRAMQDFSRGRPPQASVLLVGTTGLGKSRLLLASHLELLAAGVHSEYLSGRELSRLLRLADSYEAETQERAERALHRLRAAQALHLDDVGDPAEEERRRAAYLGGLKDLRDTSGGRWAVALNTGEDAWLGPKMVSRLLLDATVVPMAGADQRLGESRG